MNSISAIILGVSIIFFIYSTIMLHRTLNELAKTLEDLLETLEDRERRI